MPPPAPHSHPSTRPATWRSFEEWSVATGTREQRSDEFPAGATHWPADLDRRDFLKLIGGSLALAGLTACGRRPNEKIVPYVTAPENTLPGTPSFYATAMPVEGFARGILVESHSGRPTKIEGNPDHPESRGATDAITQAAVLSLYDPDRSRAPRRAGQPATWTDFENEWLRLHPEFSAAKGRGLALLTEPTTSPTQLREIHRLLDALPEARWYQHTPLARHDLDGRQVDFDFAAADVIFSIGSDCLHRHPAALRYSRAYASRRRVENGRVALNRFFAVEPTPTVTGALADVRLPLPPARTRRLLDAIATAFTGNSAITDHELNEAEMHFATSLLEAFRAQPTTSLCVAGEEQDEDIHRWALAMNERLGSAGHLQRFLPAVRSDDDQRCAGALGELAATLSQGDIRALFILGANPVYTAAANLDFSRVLHRAPLIVHVGSHVDETAALCTWHLPESHFLETWSDLRGFDGTPTIQQPLIAPLYASRSLSEVLRLITDPIGRSAYDLVRDTWLAAKPSEDFENEWHGWLNTGIVSSSPSATAKISERTASRPLPTLAKVDLPDGLTLIVQPDANVLDGRWANNPWLQELPHPITHLVWDNAALISPAFAAGQRIESGELLRLEVGGRSVTAAAWITPGQAVDCVTLSLGYGRTRTGSVGNGRGFNAYTLRADASPWHASGLQVHQLGERYPLVHTQGHFGMEGREPIRRVTPKRLSASSSPTGPSLFPSWPRGAYAWGMSIDLSTCLGCNACVVACQAENNIPSVGKEQVARGREMHWIRVDRYFAGDPANPQMLSQPVPCMHCENAPCELVCPVSATVHSSEGLNDMVYNRCIGTRYCSNNCPYKVRRFNFLDYRSPASSPLHLQDNPNVTVRERGVMEKCTYCVQRINAARITAEKENRRIRDGEVRTACQQVCPVEAIVFGDLNDSSSRVSQRKHEPIDYSLLGELNTRPRTTYLAKVQSEPIRS